MFSMLAIVLSILVTHVISKYETPCVTTDQQPGLCMPVKSCKTVYNMLIGIKESGGVISEQDKAKLSQLFCGAFNNIPHVCCPKTEIQLNVDGLKILKNNTCGIYVVNRVANGHTASIFQFPWMALLMYEDEVHPFKCGGTLITDRYVLTAAHCIKGQEHLIKKVRLGEYQISTEPDCTNIARKNQCAPPAEDIEVDELIPHEDYRNIYNDIALIRLNRKVKFKRHIKPICLPIYEHLRSKEHDSYLISGWGKTENGTSSDILMTAFVPRVNRMDCERQLRQYNLNNSLNYGHICAGGLNFVDSCRGDSGGPLGYRDLYDDRIRFIQFGIIAFGLYKCGVVNVPGSYTNVSHYMQWITDHLKEGGENTHIIIPRSIQGNTGTNMLYTAFKKLDSK